MRSDKITNGSGTALAALAVMTNGYSVMLGSNAGRDVWISHLVAGIAALICTWFLVSLCEKYPKKTFYEVRESVLGKFFGKLCSALLALLSLVTCVISLTVFSRFVQITALPQTPQIIIPMLIIIIAALSLRRGLRAASGSARLLFWFSATVFVIFVVFGTKWMDFSLLLPIGESPGEIFKGAVEVFLNRFGTIPALMAVYTRMQPEKARKRFLLSSVGGASAALVLISAVTAATLGAETAKADFYPIYTAMSVRGIGGFIQHTEILACIAMTLSLFFKSAVCLLFSDDMLTGIFNTARREGAAMPLALMCAAATQIIYRDISTLRGLVEWKSGATSVAAFYILFPAVLVLISRLRRKIQ